MKKKSWHQLLFASTGFTFIFYCVLIFGIFMGLFYFIDHTQNINPNYSHAEQQEESLFVVIEENYEDDYSVVYNRKTHVMYAVSMGMRNSGTFTMLVNADGTPQIYKGE